MGSGGLLRSIGTRTQRARATIPPIILIALATIFAVPSRAEILWYNGDFASNSFGVLNGINMTFEGQFPNPGQASVYDDFNVPAAAGGWHLDTIWSNNLMTFTSVTQAAWSIRMNLSSGDAGTVVAAGTSPVTQTPTGRSLLEFDEFTILVSGLSIDLPPGTYWLSVTPHGVGGSEASLNSVTRGLNALGSPPGNDGNSFLDSALLAADFAALDEIFFPAPDFSMGVAGSVLGAQVVPEPASIVLTALGLAGLACASMTRKSRTLGPDTRTCKRERTLFRTQIATAPTLKNPTASSRRAADQTSSIGELAISDDPERREGHGCASRTGDEVRPRDFT